MGFMPQEICMTTIIWIQAIDDIVANMTFTPIFKVNIACGYISILTVRPNWFSVMFD